MRYFLSLLIAGVSVVHAATPSVQYLTRAQASKVVLDASKASLVERKSSGRFPDVLDGQWYTSYIMNAINEDLIDANPRTGLLYPHRSISRAEFLKMITIAFDLEHNIPHRYSDVPRDAWFSPYAGTAYSYRLLPPKTDPLKLYPKLRVTHQEARGAIQQLFLLAPHLNVNVANPPTQVASTQQTLSTPALVKQAMLRLFRRQSSTQPDDTKDQILELVNQERLAAKLPPLTRNPLLDVAAQKHAKDMQQRGYFSHTNTEGETYIDRIRDTNYVALNSPKCACRAVFNVGAAIEGNRTQTTPHNITADTEVCGCHPRFALGENIAKGQLTPEQVMEDWMNSEGHRSNILHPQFEELGVGLFGSLWVQTFGRVRYD